MCQLRIAALYLSGRGAPAPEECSTLRQQAHCDPLTGLSHRGHFMAQFASALQDEEGAGTGGAVPAACEQFAGFDFYSYTLFWPVL